MAEICNTHELVVLLRRSFSRHRLAKLIECSATSIMRWEEGRCNASSKYVSGFNRAAHRLSHHYRHFPTAREAILKTVKPRVLGQELRDVE